MSGDPFGLPSKKKLAIYACLAGGIIVAGCAEAFLQDVPWWRILLWAGMMVVICGGAVGGMMWLLSGRRSEVAVGPAGVRPPVRALKALPYLIAAALVLQFIRFLFSQ